MRLELQKAYAATTVKQARNRFEAWCRWMRTEAEALTSGLPAPMRQAADIVERHFGRYSNTLLINVYTSMS
jgi:hypothetical protein